MIVWAVSQGTYSDYRVHFICESKEDAERWVGEQPRPEWALYDIEEMPFIPKGGEIPPTQVVLSMQWTSHQGQREWTYELGFWRGDEAEGCKVTFNGEGMLHVLGTDHERVRKVFGEQLAMRQALTR